MARKQRNKAISRAMIGNQNAVGNKGGKGAPKGNQFALKTGEFSAIWLDKLTEEEQELCSKIDLSPMQQIDEVITLLSVRERRMLDNIAGLKKQKELAELEIHSKGGKITSQVKYIKPLIDRIIVVEDALTRVQEKKIRAIESKQKFIEKNGLQDKDLRITIKGAAKNGSVERS